MGLVNFKPLKHKVRHQATLALWPLRSTKFLLPTSEALQWKHAYFQVFTLPLYKELLRPLVMGQGQF